MWCLFVFSVFGDYRDLHVLTPAFPTRRSIELLGREGRRRGEGGRNPDNQSRAGEERAAPEINSHNKRRPFRARAATRGGHDRRAEEHTSELQSLKRKSYTVFCLKKKRIYK